MRLHIASSKARAQKPAVLQELIVCPGSARQFHLTNAKSGPRWNMWQTLAVSRGEERNDRGREIRLENYGLFARISENLRGVRGVMVSHPGRKQRLLRLVREEAERSFERDETQAGPSS